MKKRIFAAALALVSLTAAADDRIERQVRNDPAYRANVAKAVRMLQARGYRVIDIDADDYRGRKALDVEAVKNRREYDIKLSYPGLKIIYVRPDY